MSEAMLQHPEATEVRWFNGDIYRMALTAEQTDGACAMVDATVPPGGGPIPHIHEHSDERYFLISGELEFLLGDGEEPVTARAGDTLQVPRGTLHGFHNSGIYPARMIFMFIPSGPERLFSLAGDEPVPGEQVLPWGPERVNPELLALAERCDTIVPPPAVAD